MLLPIRTDRPRIRPAYLTATIIGICVAVQIVSRTFGDESVLVRGDMAVDMPKVIAQAGLWGDNPGDLLKWFTHMFVHGNEMHLIGNMLFLWVFGSLIEDALRPLRMAALYLGGGLAAAMTDVVVGSLMGDELRIPLVGASGAIAAIMGLFMIRFHRTRVQITWFWIRSLWVVGAWGALQIFYALEASSAGGGGGVAYWAHVGGFVLGAAVAPFVGGGTGAAREYITDDPGTNVEYLRRSEKVEEAEKALKADPGNPYLLRRLAQQQRYAGDYEEATSTYQRCVYRFTQREMLDQAVEVYLELIDYNDAAAVPPDVQLKMAQRLESIRLPHAVWCYQSLAHKHPTRVEGEHALLRLAALYSQTLGQPHDALRCLQDFRRRYPNSRWAEEARAAAETLELQLGVR